MKNESSRKPNTSKVIIGIGNEYRGDDGVGLYIARKIRELNITDIDIKEVWGEGTELVGIWKDAELAIAVDAVSSDGVAGSIYRFEIGKDIVPSELFRGHSTHAFGLAEAIKLSETLGSYPKRMIVYGIEGRSFETGAGLSAEIMERAGEVITRILEDLRR